MSPLIRTSIFEGYSHDQLTHDKSLVSVTTLVWVSFDLFYRLLQVKYKHRSPYSIFILWYGMDKRFEAVAILVLKYSDDLLIKASINSIGSSSYLAIVTALACIWNLREESTMIPPDLWEIQSQYMWSHYHWYSALAPSVGVGPINAKGINISNQVFDHLASYIATQYRNIMLELQVVSFT